MTQIHNRLAKRRPPKSVYIESIIGTMDVRFFWQNQNPFISPLPFVGIVIPSMSRRNHFMNMSVMPSLSQQDCFKSPDPEKNAVGFGYVIATKTKDSPFLAQHKRNLGAQFLFYGKTSGQGAAPKYILLLDDDVTLKPNFLSMMINALEARPDTSFAYCDFDVVTQGDVDDPIGDFRFYSQIWDPEELERRNYISMISLIRASDFPGMDPSIPRFQDWDLWLTMMKEGKKGVYIPESLFTSHKIDNGTSTMISYRKAEAIIRKKHEV